MKNIFRIIAFLEGVSYILLLFIAVPIKYNLGDPTYVKLLGMPHGLLFGAYITFAILLKESKKWNKTELFVILVCSILPFGTFYADKKYFKK